jgi:receptor protein-tyrosine kinase
MNLGDFLAAMRRRWRIVVAAVVICVMATGLISWLRSPTYEASTELLLIPQGGSQAQDYGATLIASDRMATYAALVVSDAVLSELSDRIGDGESTTALRDSVSAAPITGTSLLSITAEGSSESAASRLAKGASDAFSTYVTSSEDLGPAVSQVKVATVDSASTSVNNASDTVRDLQLAAVLGLLIGVVLALMRESASRRPIDRRAYPDSASTRIPEPNRRVANHGPGA